MLALAWSAACVVAAYGYGAALARALRVRFEGSSERLLLSATLGLGVLSLLVLGIGLSGVLRAWVLWVALGGGGALAVLQWPGLLRRSSPQRGAPRLRLALMSAFGLCAVANVLGALAPPSFIDALYYHLLGPKLHVAAGAVVEIPWIWQTYQPVAVEMLYTLGMALDGPGLACVLHALLGLFAAGGAGLLAKALAGPRAAWLAALIAYGTAMIAWESTSGFVELGVAAFGTFCLYALLQWGRARARGWLMLAALFGGFAASCKLPGVVIPLLGGAVIVYLCVRARSGARATAGALLGFGAVAFLVVAPWYLRAFVWTGNPVYPFLPGLFGANAEYADLWVNLGHYGTGRGLLDFVLAPWRLVTAGDLFERAQFLSPIPLLLGPVILWRARHVGERQWLVAFAAAYFVSWFASAHVARYLVPLAPLLAALCADALLALWDEGSRLWRICAVAAAGPALLMGVASTLVYDAPLAKVALGRESETAYLTRTAWHYGLYRRLTAELPAHAKLLTSLGGTYYLDRPHVGMKPRGFKAGAEALARRILDGQFTHVLVQAGEQEAAVLACGAPVKLLWHHEDVLIQSRSFGGGIPHKVALFAVDGGVGRALKPGWGPAAPAP